MDRHDVSDVVTAENVAELHQQDLKVQHKFGCKGLTYWFDDVRKTAFCLVEAPDEKAVVAMHENAHGEVPHHVIEVDTSIVESFLGRIEDPEKSQNTSLNIINDPAFRTIMVIGFNEDYKASRDLIEPYSLIKQSAFSVIKIANDYEGSVVNQSLEKILISFKSVTNAVLFAKVIVEQNQVAGEGISKTRVSVKIGLNSGVPVTEKESIFEDTIKLAERMNYISNAQIVVSQEVIDLYKSENSKEFIDYKAMHVLSLAEQAFLNSLIDFIESEWKNTKLKVDDFSKKMGFSKSQLYRKMILLTGESPNSFLMNYRLNKALRLLKRQNSSISEIAFDSGFNSPSYFSKCFSKKFHLTPSEYLAINN